MELFPPEFSQPNAGVPGDGTDETQIAQAALEAQSQHATPNDALSENNLDGASASEPPLRGKAATQGLTQEEKKERQKQQNRRAAERSRNKKREELTALEMTVNNIQDENQRLRARLASLLASKPSDASQPAGEADAPIPTGIDYTGLAKLQAELAQAKATLLQRELDLSNAHGHDTDDGDGVRAALLSSTAQLQSVQAEVKTLQSLISHLRSERDTFSRQRDVLSRELDARRVLRETVGDVPGGNARAAGVERALLDLRALVDGVLKTWEQSSVLPSHHNDENEAEPGPEQE